MEVLSSKFPVICDIVLSNLDDQSLTRCKVTSREMCHYLDQGNLLEGIDNCSGMARSVAKKSFKTLENKLCPKSDNLQYNTLVCWDK